MQVTLGPSEALGANVQGRRSMVGRGPCVKSRGHRWDHMGREWGAEKGEAGDGIWEPRPWSKENKELGPVTRAD